MYRQRRVARAFAYQRDCGPTAFVRDHGSRHRPRPWRGAPAYEAFQFQLRDRRETRRRCTTRSTNWARSDIAKAAAPQFAEKTLGVANLRGGHQWVQAPLRPKRKLSA
jgi:hypothetical protein